MKKSEPKPLKYILSLPDRVIVGGLVRYYLEGWRVGTLMEVSGNDAGIQPVATYKHVAERERLTWVNVSDLKSLD